MALATNTTPGSVILKGDMTGTSSAPELRVSGAVAGTYGPANVVVDAKGRIIYAKISDWDNDVAPLFPDATDTTAGKILVCDPQLSIIGGTVALNMQDATTTLKGKVQVGAGMQVIDGNMEIAYASVFSKGIMQAGPGLSVTAGELSVAPPIATTATLGGIIAKDGITVDNEGNLRVDIATTSTTGIVKVGTGLSVDGTGNLTLNTSFATATTSTPGIIKVGSGLGVSGVGNLTLDVAGAGGSAGIIKIGSGLSVDGAGNITTPLATTTTKGVVKVGSGLDVDGDGNIHIKYATTTATGIVKIGTGLDVDGTGNVTMPLATTIDPSDVIPDVGNNSPYPEDYTLGSVIVPGTGIDLVSDTISVKTASYTENGVAQFYHGPVWDESFIYDNFYLNCSNGQLSYVFGGPYAGQPGILAPYTPVKPGNGFSVDANGVLSLFLPATTTTLGFVKIGTGLAVDGTGNLTLNAPIATTSTTGAVKIGTGLDVDGAGNVTIATAVLRTNLNTSLTKSQSNSIGTLAAGATVAWDGSAGNIFYIDSPAGAFTLANGTNIVPGACYNFIINKADGNEIAITYGSQFVFRTATTRSTSGVKSVLSCFAVDANTLHCIMQPNFV